MIAFGEKGGLMAEVIFIITLLVGIACTAYGLWLGGEGDLYEHLCKLYRKLTPTSDEVVFVRMRSGETNEPYYMFLVYAKLFNLIPIRIAISDPFIQSKMAEIVRYGYLTEDDKGKENLNV